MGLSGNTVIMRAVWAAAVLKVIGAILPLAAVGMIPGQTPIARRRLVRALAWLEAAILTIYALVLTIPGLPVQSGLIPPPATPHPPPLPSHPSLCGPSFP